MNGKTVDRRQVKYAHKLRSLKLISKQEFGELLTGRAYFSSQVGHIETFDENSWRWRRGRYIQDWSKHI